MLLNSFEFDGAPDTDVNSDKASSINNLQEFYFRHNYKPNSETNLR